MAATFISWKKGFKFVTLVGLEKHVLHVIQNISDHFKMTFMTDFKKYPSTLSKAQHSFAAITRESLSLIPIQSKTSLRETTSMN